MAVTMRDVATHAGVSMKTVSNVVNDYPHIRPETRERVVRAIEALGYRVNVTARQLARGRTGVIGLAVPDLRVPYFAELADSVMRATESRGLTLLLEQTGRSDEHDRNVLTSPRRQMTDGLLCSPLGIEPEDLRSLKIDYPLVILGDRVGEAPWDHVTMANVDGARSAVLHLAERGRRRIAVLGVRPAERIGTAVLRLEGAIAGMAEAGLELDDRLIGQADQWLYQTGIDAMAQVLETGAPFDAVFAFSDALAIGAMHALRSRGMRIPDDVAVVGFDNISEGAVSAPPLTTVDPGREAIARSSVDMLIERIDGLDAEPRRLVTPHHLEVRASS